jgi:hypothetical protein
MSVIIEGSVIGFGAGAAWAYSRKNPLNFALTFGQGILLRFQDSPKSKNRFGGDYEFAL